MAEREFFGVFEGGGAKGIAHCAGHLAAEELGIRFRAVSGASAGAIYASLVAFGYQSADIFSPDDPTQHVLRRVMGIGVLDMLGGEAQWLASNQAFTKARTLGLPMPLLIKLLLGWWWYRKNGGMLRSILSELGHLDTTKIQQGLNRAYLAQLRRFDPDRFADDNKLVVFADLDPDVLHATAVDREVDPQKLPHLADLKVVLTNVTSRELQLCDRHKTPGLAIAEAVAASISIPLVFKPAQRRRHPLWRRTALPSGEIGALSTLQFLESQGQIEPSKFADGGMVSNLPIWVFEEERRTTLAHSSHVLAFSLVDRPAALNGVARRQVAERKFLPYLGAVARTAVFGGQQVLRETIDRVEFIELPTGLDVLDFAADVPEVVETFRMAHRAAAGRLNRRFKAEPLAAEEILKSFVGTVVDFMDRRSSGFRSRIDDGKCRVRGNIALPFGAASLRIRHSYGMDEDADDDLLLPRSCLGIGTAFTRRQAIAIDYERARAEKATSLNRYTAARIWPGLKTMLCVPIFNPTTVWSDYDAEQRLALPDHRVVGVMTFDCNERVRDYIVSMLQDPEDVAQLRDAAQAWNRFDLNTQSLLDGLQTIPSQ